MDLKFFTYSIIGARCQIGLAACALIKRVGKRGVNNEFAFAGVRPRRIRAPRRRNDRLEPCLLRGAQSRIYRAALLSDRC